MQEIKDYVRSERAAGRSDVEITESLKHVGWQDEEIQKALSEFNDPVDTTEPIIMPQASRYVFLKKYKVPIAIILAIALVSLGGYKAYSYFFINSPDAIWKRTSAKMLGINSADVKFEVSYSEIATEENKNDGFTGSFLGSGGELRFGLSGEGKMVIKSMDVDYDMTSRLSYRMGSLDISLGFDSRKVGDYVYYKLDGNPLAALFGGSSDEKPAWSRTNIKEANNEVAILDSQKSQIIESFKQSRLMYPTKLLGTENIDGVATWHYQATVDKQELKNYFAKVSEILGEKDDSGSLVDKLEFKKLELWIGKNDHMIHQAVIETSAPSIITTLSSSFGTNKSRDARRIADARQIMTALELFYYDNERYPVATNAQPSAEDGTIKFNTYIRSYPQSPAPADGGCDDPNNKYAYEQLDGGRSYRMVFCIGGDNGGFEAGLIEASPTGMKHITSLESAPIDPFEGIPFSGTIQIKLNLSSFNSKVEIEEPQDYTDSGAHNRDVRRLTNSRQIMTALELFYNDNGRYPTATNGQPTPTDGGGDEKFSRYLLTYPEVVIPPDGNCNAETNSYKYEQLQQGKDYRLMFCLGGDSGGFTAGPMEASSAGLQNR